MARFLTDREVTRLQGTKKLNPDLIDDALLVLRGIYLGYALPMSAVPLLRKNLLIPVNKLLLDPELTEKIQDEVGSINVATLQSHIEKAGKLANRTTEITNKILDIHNRVVEQSRVRVPGFPSLPTLPIPRVKVRIPPPYSGKWINNIQHLFFIDTVGENERRKENAERVRLIGADLPKDNFFDTIKHATTLAAESQWLASNLLKSPATALGVSGATLTYLALTDSEKFKTFQGQVRKSINAETEVLKKSKVFQKYKEDWPILGDSLFTAFAGVPATLMQIPLREGLTIALMAADDPAVKKIAYGIATGQDQTDEGWENLFKEINRTVTTNVLNGSFRDARYLPDIATSFAVTSPAVWESLGVANPSVNYVWESAIGLKRGIQNLRQKMTGGLVKKWMEFFESKDLLGFEEYMKGQTNYLKSILGPKYGSEMVDKLKTQFDKAIRSTANNIGARTKSARQWRQFVNGMVTSRLGPMKNVEKMAAILKFQTGKKLKDGTIFDGFKAASPKVKAVWNNDIVDDTVKYFRGRMDKVRIFDPGLPEDPHYFPAWRVFGEDEAQIVETYAGRGFLKSREKEIVIPTLKTLGQDMMNFVDRMAAPQYMSFLKDRTTTARGAASAMMGIVSKAFKEPAAHIDDLANLYKQTVTKNGVKVGPSPFNQFFSQFQNTVLLTSRAGDWLKRNVLDDGIRFAINVYDGFKAGKIPTLKALRAASSRQSPPELYDGMMTRYLLDDADPATMGNISKVIGAYNTPFFSIAENLQKGALKFAQRFNFASNEADYLARTGLSKLDDKGLQIVTAKAVETSRDYMLADRVNSAFTSSLGGKLLFAYPGFYTSLAGFVGRELGRSPELFKAGGRLASMLYESNAEEPRWNKFTLKAFGRSFRDLASVSMFPIAKAIAHIDYDKETDTKEANLKKDMETVEKLPPDQQLEVLAQRPDLRNFGSRRGLRAVGSFIETFQDMNFIPFGLGSQAVLNYFKVVRRRSPYWIAGSKQLAQFGKAINWEWLSVEGNLNPVVSAYQRQLFDIGAFYKRLDMKAKGVFDGKNLNESQRQEMAEKEYRLEQFNDLIFKRFFGFGKKHEKNITELQNSLSRFYGARDFLVPPPEDVEKIKQETGIRDDDQAEFLWKSGQMFADSSRREAADYRQKLINQYPFIPRLLKLMGNKQQLSVALGITDAQDRLNKAPLDTQASYAKTDRLYSAFVKLYKGRFVTNEDGEEVYKFDDNRSVGEVFAAWKFARPREKRKMLDDPDVEMVVKELDVENYNKYKLIRNKNYVAPVEKSQEDIDADLKTLPIQNIIQLMNFFNPFGGPMDSFDFFIDGNAEKIEGFIKKSGEALKKLGQVDLSVIATLDAAEPEFLTNFQAQKRRFQNPKSQIDRDAVAEVNRFVQDFSAMPEFQRSDAELGDEEKKAEFFQERIIRAPTIVQEAMKALHPALWQSYVFERTREERQSGNVTGHVVGYSEDEQKRDYQTLLYRVLTDPAVTQDTLKDTLARGQVEVLGRKLIDRVRTASGKSRALVETVEHQASGHLYRLGFQFTPNFDLNNPVDAQMFERYKELNFSKPGETRPEWEQRFEKTTQDEKAWPTTSFIQFTDFLRRSGSNQDAEILSDIRQGAFKPLPLDRRTRNIVESFRNEMPFIEDDPVLLRQRLIQDPELTTTLLNHAPRLYRTLQNKLFSANDKGWLAYLQTNGFAPGAVDYMKKLAPQSYARLYWKNSGFRARMDSFGYPPPAPTAETSVTREWTDFNGVTHTRTIPDVLTPPEPIAPTAVPQGTFASLPAMLNFAAQDTRDEVYRIKVFEQGLKSQGRKLPKADDEFLNGSSNTERIFKRFPSIIARAFREGKLGPDEVISTLKGVSDFGLTVGAVAPEQHRNFINFLANTTNVMGATRFGFGMGAFLDDAFNIPRIPVSSAFIDFALAGRPVSTIPVPISTNQATSLAQLGGVRAAFDAKVPAFNQLGPSAQPLPSVPALPGTADVALQGAQTSTQGAAAATAGIPGVGATFAAISTGFAIANMIRSRRQRRQARREAQKQREEQQRQIRISRARAEAERAAATGRQIAQGRFRRVQQADRARQQDFQRRLQQVLAEGVSFAAIGQQPKEFVNAFVDNFEPELIEFTRRPQLDSRVNLIDRIQSRIPQARF